MITFIRTAQAMPGKIGDLIACGKEIAAIHRRLVGTALKVGSAFGNDPTQAAWIGEYEALDKIADMLSKLSVDQEYQQVLRRLGTVIVPGSIRDHIWRHI
jgi:hypothetical protein